MGRLDGRIALVTGAARPRGIGQGIVRALLGEGAAGVLFTDVDDKCGATTEQELARDHGDRVMYMHQDVTSPEEWAMVRETVLERFGRLDVLVNNAGTSFNGSISTLSLSDLRHGMAVNFESQFLGIQTCGPTLARFAPEHEGGASIINNSSMAAYLVDPAALAYHVSKSAVRMLTMCAAREFGPQRIRVNSVHFGTILTPMMETAIRDYALAGKYSDADAARTGLAAMSPLGRLGDSSDAGSLVAFLASDEARFITGAAYVQDGGSFMQY